MMQSKKLLQNLKRNRIDAFRRVAIKRDPSFYPLAVIVGEFRILLNLPNRHQAPTAPKDLVFNEELMTLSQNYRSTFLKATSMGVRFTPRILPKSKIYADWDPLADELFYAPLASEVRELSTLRDPNEIKKKFPKIKNKLYSTYHELNHWIFFRSIAPATSRVENRKFFGLIESLVRLRDLEIAEELGPLGLPFFAANTINYAFKVKTAPKPYSAERFKLLLAYLYCQTMGWPHQKIQREIPKHLGGLEIHHYFYEHTRHSQRLTEKWLDGYCKKNGKFVPKNKYPQHAIKRSLMQIENQDLDLPAFLADKKLHSRLHQAYACLFYSSRTP